MGVVVQAVELEVAAPLPVVERAGEPYLELGPVAAPLPTGSSPEGWTAPLEARVAGIGVGERWTVLGDDGARASCAVVALERHADSADGYGTVEDPTCGGWVAFAKLACGAGERGWSGVAVPGDPPAASFAPGPASDLDRQRAWSVLATDAGWLGRQAALRAGGREPAVELDVRAYGPWRVAEATVYTGQGEAQCGGADLLERRVLVLDAAGAVVWSPRAVPDPWDRSMPSVEGVYDLERDGVPELRLARPFTELDVVDREGKVRVHRAVRFCGCPC